MYHIYWGIPVTSRLIFRYLPVTSISVSGMNAGLSVKNETGIWFALLKHNHTISRWISYTKS